MNKEDNILILNINHFNSGHGGQASFIKNLHPFLSKEFSIRYLVLPDSLIRQAVIPLRLLYLFQVLFFLIRQKNKFKIIVSHTPEASYVSSFFRIPLIHIFHGNNNPLTKSVFWYGKYFRWIYEIFEKRIINKAAILYTVGENRDGVRKFYNPIVPRSTGITAKSDRKDFVFAGRLEKIKNVDIIIEIYNSLPQDYKSDSKLQIIGAGTQEAKLKKLVSKLGLEDKVIFHGQLENEKAIDIISNCLILIMASSHEGFPMVIAESLTVGTPVVSSNVGDIKSVVRNGYNGFTVSLEKGTSVYVEKITQILDDYNKFSENSVKSSSIFNAERIALSFIEDCKKLLNTATVS